MICNSSLTNSESSGIEEWQSLLATGAARVIHQATIAVVNEVAADIDVTPTGPHYNVCPPLEPS